MSTLEENITHTSKTSGDFTGNLVKIEDACFSSAPNIDCHCGKLVDEKENFKNFNSTLINNYRNIRQSEFEKFRDPIKDAGRSGAASEEPEEKTSGTEEEETLQSDEELTIDIKPTVLEQDPRDLEWFKENSENFNSTPKTFATAKKRFSDFFKSLCILCDICDDVNTQRVIKLNRQEKIVAAVILRKSFGIGLKTKTIFPTKIPEQTCCRCFTKIILLYNRHKNKYSQKRIKEEAAHDMEQSSHGYHCMCPTCQNQYGALPVLLKGIEEQDKMQSSQSQVNFQPDHLALPQLIDLPQPVTVQHQEQVNFQQYLVKYEEQPFPTHLQEPYQTSQSNTTGYSRYQMPESQMEVNFQPTNLTEIDLSQTPSSIFNAQRLNVEQDRFDVNYQDQPEYYVSEGSVVSAGQSLDESNQEQNLPTLLQELEEKCQTELQAGQPSTSSGIQGQSYAQDDKQSKKIMTCEHCHKNFTHKGDFNKHQRKHTKEKPYKCSFCDKMFSHTSNLHRHQRIHSGDRPFKCQYCDKHFNRKDKLENHKNSKICKNRRN